MLTIARGEDGRLALGGRLDAAQAGVLQSALAATSGVVTLDCHGLDYVSSAGLSVLLRTQKRLLSASGKVRLVGLKPHIHDIFVYSGFDQLFEIVADPDADISNFPPPRA